MRMNLSKTSSVCATMVAAGRGRARQCENYQRIRLFLGFAYSLIEPFAIQGWVSKILAYRIADHFCEQNAWIPRVRQDLFRVSFLTQLEHLFQAKNGRFRRRQRSLDLLQTFIYTHASPPVLALTNSNAEFSGVGSDAKF